MSTFFSATDRQTDRDEDARFQCRHIFPDGRRCGSPCLRSEELCYYHHTTRRPIAAAPARKARRGSFSLSVADLVDRSGIQFAIAEVLQRIASNDIDPRRAGLLLYGLQTASLILPKAPAKPVPVVLVDEITEHPTLGTLAPVARISDLKPKSGVAKLLEELRSRSPVAIQATPEPQPELPEPITLPEIQACQESSTPSRYTPNLNPLRTLHQNRRGGGARRNGAKFMRNFWRISGRYKLAAAVDARRVRKVSKAL
jgi:hypothetical protein